MTNEPTKAAIERACELHGYTYAEYCSAEIGSLLRGFIDRTAHHLAQVSETSKLNDTIVEQHLAKSILGQNWKDRAAKAREGNKALILPDPEPDVLYDALFAVVELGRYDTREQTELLKGELAKRGYAITKTGDTSHG